MLAFQDSSLAKQKIPDTTVSRPSNKPVVDDNKEGWVKSLKFLPRLTTSEIDKKLIFISSTMPSTETAPKAYRNKKLGYRLWKEGYVRSLYVKPNVKAKCTKWWS